MEAGAQDGNPKSTAVLCADNSAPGSSSSAEGGGGRGGVESGSCLWEKVVV